MSDRSEELLDELEAHYRSGGWKVRRPGDGTVESTGPGGVTLDRRPVVPADLAREGFEAEIVSLAERRMPAGGELCPLDLLPASECEGELRALLDRAGLGDRPHVSVYSFAAAA